MKLFRIFVRVAAGTLLALATAAFFMLPWLTTGN